MRYLLAGLVIFGAMFANANIAKRFVKDRTRIVAQDAQTIPGSVITTYRKGDKVWSTTNILRVVNRPVVRPIKYSKLKLIRAAKTAGKWDALKAAISAMDMDDEWQACQHIQSDDPAYIAATNAVVTRGIATEDAVKAFMKQAED